MESWRYSSGIECIRKTNLQAAMKKGLEKYLEGKEKNQELLVLVKDGPKMHQSSSKIGYTIKISDDMMDINIAISEEKIQEFKERANCAIPAD